VNRLFETSWNFRRLLVLLLFACGFLLLVLRATQLQVLKHDFYREQGLARQQRIVEIAAHRGNILDRHGEPLAVSTPIDSVWAVPEEAVENMDAVARVGEALGLETQSLLAKVQTANDQGKEFVYIKRHVTPGVAEQVKATDAPGIALMREYRRYYPSGSAATHIIGFTNIDDVGQEGMEMAFDQWLRGKPGKRKVVRDLKGREIEGVDILDSAIAGKDLHLSIDKQLQYFAERSLASSVEKHRASSGSVIVLDVNTGEVMAMVNYPSYNPNNKSSRKGDDGRQRNRAITDVFEPGSTMKPFTIAAALESGQFRPEDIIFTSPGAYKIGKYEVRDEADYGWLDLRGIIRKSSNVGVSKVATQLEPNQLWGMFDRLGFGRPTGSAFPGEVAGYFNHPTLWHHVEQATLSYGYGISVSALQLVRAYAAIANGGMLPQISFVKNKEAVQSERVLDADIALELHEMLESVVSEEGTGRRANVPGYRIAGKTGTSHRSQGGGYAEDRYISLFAGFAPVSEPRFAAVVVVHDPSEAGHFGGVVAAPVFAEVMASALRLGGIEPDNLADAEMRSLALPSSSSESPSLVREDAL